MRSSVRTALGQQVKVHLDNQQLPIEIIHHVEGAKATWPRLTLSLAARTHCSLAHLGTRREFMEWMVSLPLFILDDLGMRKLPLTAAEYLLEIVMRHYERASTIVTSNRPVEDWGKLLGDAAAVTAMLDRLLHHGHLLKCGPRSWRTKTELSAK
jgi:hypothetical protein